MPTDSLPSKYNSRRNFLRTGVTATLATAAYPALGSARVVDPLPPPSPTVTVAVTVRDFELDEITIDDLQKALQSGQYFSRSVTEKYQARIQEIDKAGPMVNSVIELNPEALQIADALDQERKSMDRAGPFMAFQSSSRTISIPWTGCIRRRDRWRCSNRALRTTLLSPRSCVRPAP